MEATAKLRFTRLSPRRTRLVADAIRGKRVEEALNILEFMSNKPSFVIKKVLKSAIANAGNKDGMDTDTLYIARLLIDEGPMWTRYMPRAMGRATVIRKKTSHINITLSDGFKPKKGSKKKVVVRSAKKAGAKKKATKKTKGKEETKMESQVNNEKDSTNDTDDLFKYDEYVEVKRPKITKKKKANQKKTKNDKNDRIANVPVKEDKDAAIVY